MSLGLFEGFGVELEYMLVERDGLAVLPRTDALIHAAVGSYEEEIERGALCWSNELVLHVVELKTNGPAGRLEGLAKSFQEGIAEVGALLQPLGGRLLGTGAHPFMDPERETRLWPHDASPIYECFDRIFGCRGHGWSNLQSTHLNLPFREDEEFGRLHAAIRLLLPLLPGLAASTPILDGRVTGSLDSRLAAYRTNAARVPSVTGAIVPEPVYARAHYEREILQRIYDDMAPLDPEGVVRHEWVNARGAIARFDRDTIEIRVLDIQECPAMDLAIIAASVAVLRGLVSERWSRLGTQQAADTGTLAQVLGSAILSADAATVTDPTYLECLGLPPQPTSVGEVWRSLLERVADEVAPWRDALALLTTQGPLARRILRALDGDASRERLVAVYTRLADCLDAGIPFEP